MLGGRTSRMTPKERFNTRWELDPESGCWLWLGYTSKDGYGVCGSGKGRGKNTTAHRVSYEYNRSPIPEGLHLDHLCHNRKCVNPDHLDAVTREENVRRSNARRTASITHCRKAGHELTPENTVMVGNTRRCRTCRQDIDRETKRRKRQLKKES